MVLAKPLYDSGDGIREIGPSISTSPQKFGMRPYPLTYEQSLTTSRESKTSITEWIGSQYVVQYDGNDEKGLGAVLSKRQLGSISISISQDLEAGEDEYS